MNKKTAIITGATSGIGRLACDLLVKENIKLYITSRTKSKGLNVIEAIKLKYPFASIDFLVGDLSTFKGLNNIIKTFKEQENKLDILINNAGCFTQKRLLTKAGYEQQFFVNYIAPRHLSLALLPLLKVADQGRIVNVSSRMHLRGKIDFEDLQMKKNYKGYKAYANTKLLLTTHTNYLAKMVHKNVSVVSMHPGVFSTGITRNLPQTLKWAWNFFLPNPEKGAQNIVHLALNDRQNGIYFNKTKASQSNPLANDIENQQKLEKITNDLLSN